jgi:AcrR family transcriptional regulator
VSTLSSVTKPSKPTSKVYDARRHKLLDTALLVFARFGFRKTSMDEVARAAGVSRQGLYLHFSTKEDLFRATAQHSLATALQAAAQRLDDASLSVEQRLVGALDEWVGRWVGVFADGVSDLAEARDTLAGPLFATYEKLFLEALSRTMRSSGLLAAYKATGLTSRQLADTLYATARGLKHSAASRAAFGDEITGAVRAMCLPLQLAARPSKRPAR